MGCFTRAARVDRTSIFARAVGSRQILVYQMTYAAAEPLALVLPLPVPPGSPGDAVRFIGLETCAGLFTGLRDAFRDRPAFRKRSRPSSPVRLAVVEAGSYEASFVPRAADFLRLDERFRPAEDLWPHLSAYRDWGFAVFKLKAAAGSRPPPMALEFPRRDLARLFFPTLHAEPYMIRSTSHVDYSLYCQPDPPMFWHLDDWQESAATAREHVRCEEALPLFDAEFPLWHLRLAGMQENADAWVGRGGTRPREMEIV